jgi:hypothetical protein
MENESSVMETEVYLAIENKTKCVIERPSAKNAYNSRLPNVTIYVV